MESLVILVLFVSFFLFLILGVPVSFSIGLSTFAALLVNFPAITATEVIAQKVITGLNSFGLLAIPFFILAGNIMNQGGIAQRLIDFAKIIGGPLPGALAHINILANMMFGAISGSAVSAAAAVGGVMSPVQRKEKYNPAFSAAVNIASCPSGLLIPPSGALILFSLVSGGTSVAALFLAGYVPGTLMGLGLMLVAAWIAKRNQYPKFARSNLSESLRVSFRALPSLLLILIVIGGIIQGIFTATEASAVAVLYSLSLALLYRELKFKEIPKVFTESIVTTCIVLFLVGVSISMSWVMASANVPVLIFEALYSVSSNPYVILLMLNFLLLVIGTFMDLTPALLIFTPIFLPVAIEIGLDPVHFGILMVYNLCIGIATPPVGSALFVGCSVGQVEVPKVIPYLLPMYAVLFFVLLLIVYIPSLSLFLPRWMGLM